jgi:preprotein translocase subunit SecF
MGVMIIGQIKLTLPVVAALLTIIGYDINDTIVVYDRIRENIAKGRSGDLRTTMNIALNETLSRTIITSGVTMLSVVSIWLLGGGTTSDFAFLLFIGMIFGSYSTIFIASPITLYLDKYFKKSRMTTRA